MGYCRACKKLLSTNAIMRHFVLDFRDLKSSQPHEWINRAILEKQIASLSCHPWNGRQYFSNAAWWDAALLRSSHLVQGIGMAGLLKIVTSARRIRLVIFLAMTAYAL